jgi:hypothetical protein
MARMWVGKTRTDGWCSLTPVAAGGTGMRHSAGSGPRFADVGRGWRLRLSSAH